MPQFDDDMRLFSRYGGGRLVKQLRREKELDDMGVRTLSVIAREIRADWKKVYFGAVPYLEAMETMQVPCEKDEIGKALYGADPAKEIILYFLSNASGWRGETAKRVKAELKAAI